MSKTQKFPDSGGGAPSPGLKKSSGSRSAEQLELPTKKHWEKSAGLPETTTPWTGLLGFDGALIIDGERGGSALVAALEKKQKKQRHSRTTLAGPRDRPVREFRAGHGVSKLEIA